MQAGWAFRRGMEAETARAALRWAAASGVRTAPDWQACTNDLERLAYLARRSRGGSEKVVAELANIVATAPEGMRPAAREALRKAVGRGRRVMLPGRWR